MSEYNIDQFARSLVPFPGRPQQPQQPQQFGPPSYLLNMPPVSMPPPHVVILPESAFRPRSRSRSSRRHSRSPRRRSRSSSRHSHRRRDGTPVEWNRRDSPGVWDAHRGHSHRGGNQSYRPPRPKTHPPRPKPDPPLLQRVRQLEEQLTTSTRNEQRSAAEISSKIREITKLNDDLEELKKESKKNLASMELKLSDAEDRNRDLLLQLGRLQGRLQTLQEVEEQSGEEENDAYDENNEVGGEAEQRPEEMAEEMAMEVEQVEQEQPERRAFPRRSARRKEKYE